MSKQAMIQSAVSSLAQLGIQCSTGAGADITIGTEFLDAGFSTGNKKITYEASVFFNEQDGVAYMYEKTTEVGQGLSFGSEGGSSFQSGTTLFRKVKSVQYAPDGKAYEYTLNLGAIPKAVKEAALAGGFKFKTVISKSKAMYPTGTIPAPVLPDAAPTPPREPVMRIGGFCANCGMPLAEGARFCDKCGMPVGTAAAAEVTPPAQTPVLSAEQPFCTQSRPQTPKKGVGPLGIIAFILLAVIALAFFALSTVNPVGWVLCILLILTFAFLFLKLMRKGCLFTVVLWIAAFALLFLTWAFTLKSTPLKAVGTDAITSTIADRL